MYTNNRTDTLVKDYLLPPDHPDYVDAAIRNRFAWTRTRFDLTPIIEDLYSAGRAADRLISIAKGAAITGTTLPDTPEGSNPVRPLSAGYTTESTCRTVLVNLLQAPPERCDMGDWITTLFNEDGRVEGEGENGASCGTVGCLAGWVVLSEHRFVAPKLIGEGTVISTLSTAALGGNPHINTLYSRGGWPQLVYKQWQELNQNLAKGLSLLHGIEAHAIATRVADRESIITLLALLGAGRIGVWAGDHHDEGEEMALYKDATLVVTDRPMTA